jgi:hypothetical protein
MMDHLLRRVITLNGLLTEPRQMGTKIASRQRVDNFNGI